MKMEQAECSETFAYKIPTPGNYPEESIQDIFLFLQHTQTGPGIYPLFYKTCTVFFFGVKPLGLDVDHSTPSSQEVKE
jgi:hypothetical protein